VFGLGGVSWYQWTSFLIAFIVQAFAGAPFYRGAWNQLKVGSSNMDTLVALGSSTAFGYSVWALFSGYSGHLYFMEAAAIISLVSTGHWMESRVTVRASNALKDLMNLAPPTARKLDVVDFHVGKASTPPRAIFSTSFSNIQSPIPDRRARSALPTDDTNVQRKETEVPVSELVVGDLVALRPGDRVPTDGDVVAG